MSLFDPGTFPALDANGNPLSGAQWLFFLTGTDTPAPVYADADLGTSLGAVVTADSSGRFQPIYLDGEVTYRAILKNAAGTTVPNADIDPVNGGGVSSGVIGLFADASEQIISADLVQTSGYHTVGQGAARYFYDAAVDASYVTANPRASFVSANGRGFRLAETTVTPQMFGAYGDHVTDDYAAFRAALDYDPFVNPFDDAYVSVRKIKVPAAFYAVGTTLQIKRTTWLCGLGSGHFLGGYPSILFPPGVTGIIYHSNNTINNGVESPATTGSDGSIFEGIHLQGNTTAAADSYGGHGIKVRAQVLIRNPVVQGFKGNGIHIVATAGSGGATEGNANLWRIEGGTSFGNTGHGLFVDGADVNAGGAIFLNTSSNGGWGIDDSSFLGNTYIGPHGADNVAGPYKSDDVNARSVFLGAYAESGQPNSEISAPSLIIGGLIQGITGNAGQVHSAGDADGGGLLAGYPIVADGGIVINNLVSAVDDATAAGLGVRHNQLYWNTTTNAFKLMVL